MKIGKVLKEIRKSKKMTLSELSQKSGIQIATLSRIEHNKMTGTLESHLKIAQALQINLPLLYSSASKLPSSAEVNAQKKSLKKINHNDKASYEILASDLSHKKMMPMLLKIDANGKSSAEQFPLGHERFLFVLEGTVEVKILADKKADKDVESYSLSKNNSLYLEASITHYIKNTGKSRAKILSVLSPVSI